MILFCAVIKMFYIWLRLLRNFIFSNRFGVMSPLPWERLYRGHVGGRQGRGNGRAGRPLRFWWRGHLLRRMGRRQGARSRSMYWPKKSGRIQWFLALWIWGTNPNTFYPLILFLMFSSLIHYNYVQHRKCDWFWTFMAIQDDLNKTKPDMKSYLTDENKRTI